jgi:hypothetical protein
MPAVHSALRMLMTLKTGEHPVVLGIGMADIAATPDSGVTAGKNREVRVMFRKISRLPIGENMTFLATRAESHFGMGRICGPLEIGLMTENALRF